jgi:uncharacterized damage-inducible protein DinB
MTQEPAPESLPEPWMRGPLPGVELHVMPVFFSFIQVREDLAKHTAHVTPDDVWRKVGSLPSLGFHLRHIAGSVDRLSTYLMGENLTDQQLAFLRAEAEPGETLEGLLKEINSSLAQAEACLRRIHAAQLHEPRYIGRQRLPSTVWGLLVHLAEHTQRHLGQTITTAKLARNTQK